MAVLSADHSVVAGSCDPVGCTTPPRCSDGERVLYDKMHQELQERLSERKSIARDIKLQVAKITRIEKCIGSATACTRHKSPLESEKAERRRLKRLEAERDALETLSRRLRTLNEAIDHGLVRYVRHAKRCMTF